MEEQVTVLDGRKMKAAVYIVEEVTRKKNDILTECELFRKARRGRREQRKA